MPEPIAVTGIGIITAAGNNREQTWSLVVSGGTAIDVIDLWDCLLYPADLGGQIRHFDPEVHFGKRRARRLDRCQQLLLVAAREAVGDSGLSSSGPPEPE